jgi:hypothetical protein
MTGSWDGYCFQTVRHPETGEVIVRRNELIDEDIAKEIVDAGIEEVVDPFGADMPDPTRGVQKMLRTQPGLGYAGGRSVKPSESLPPNRSVNPVPS